MSLTHADYVKHRALAATRPHVPLASYVRPDTSERQPALPGFIVRRCFAAKAKPGRQTVIEAARAELAWAIADYQRITGYVSHDARYDGPHPADTFRLPHEWAAARVLNAWGHLHPTEWRIRENIAVLSSQIDAGWTERANATREYMRLLWADRARQSKAFHAAVAEYQRLRRDLNEVLS